MTNTTLVVVVVLLCVFVVSATINVGLLDLRHMHDRGDGWFSDDNGNRLMMIEQRDGSYTMRYIPKYDTQMTRGRISTVEMTHSQLLALFLKDQYFPYTNDTCTLDDGRRCRRLLGNNLDIWDGVQTIY